MSYLPVGSSNLGAKPGNTGFTDALARAREIAARLKGGKPESVESDGSNASKRGSNLELEGVTYELGSENSMKRYHYDDSLNLFDGNASTPGSTGSPMNYTAAPRTLKTTVEFIVPGYKVGLIIGTRGENLKRIEKATDTRITFDPLTTPNPADMAERRVYIIGVPEDCDSAKKLILEKIEEPSFMDRHSGGGGGGGGGSGGLSITPPIFKDSFGNPYPSLQFTIPNPKVGLVIGRSGETIRDLQDKSGAKIFVAPDSTVMPDQTERLISISGPEENLKLAKSLLEELLLEGGPRGVSAGSSTNPDYSKANVTLTVPDNMVGLLIGKKGENFKNMIQQSRARIVIDPPVSNGSPTRLVYISGSPESIAIAQAMIHEKLSGSAMLDGSTYYAMGTNPAPNSSDPYSMMYDYNQYYYANAAASPVDPYAAYYQQYYASMGYPTAATTDVNAASPVSQSSSVAAVASPQEAASSIQNETPQDPSHSTTTYSQSQLDSFYQYYYDYYVQAGLDDSSAADAALAAMSSAGLPYDKHHTSSSSSTTSTVPLAEESSTTSHHPSLSSSHTEDLDETTLKSTS